MQKLHRRRTTAGAEAGVNCLGSKDRKAGHHQKAWNTRRGEGVMSSNNSATTLRTIMEDDIDHGPLSHVWYNMCDFSIEQVLHPNERYRYSIRCHMTHDEEAPPARSHVNLGPSFRLEGFFILNFSSFGRRGLQLVVDVGPTCKVGRVSS
jgi:hypothetical protein